MTPEPVRCIVCLAIKRGKSFTRGGGKRTLRGWVCGRCLDSVTPEDIREIARANRLEKL